MTHPWLLWSQAHTPLLYCSSGESVRLGLQSSVWHSSIGQYPTTWTRVNGMHANYFLVLSNQASLVVTLSSPPLATEWHYRPGKLLNKFYTSQPQPHWIMDPSHVCHDDWPWINPVRTVQLLMPDCNKNCPRKLYCLLDKPIFSVSSRVVVVHFLSHPGWWWNLNVFVLLWFNLCMIKSHGAVEYSALLGWNGHTSIGICLG